MRLRYRLPFWRWHYTLARERRRILKYSRLARWARLKLFDEHIDEPVERRIYRAECISVPWNDKRSFDELQPCPS